MKHKLNLQSLLTIALFLISTNYLSAQKKVKFGKVSKEELQMTRYEKDTAAEAVILYDIGHSSIVYDNEKGFVVEFTNHTRIKILKKDGLDNATKEIFLYYGKGGEHERLTSLKARSYNLEGEKIVITKLAKKNIYKEEQTKHWKAMKFAIPNVKVGSVIEYRYTTRSPYIYNFQTWYFQNSIPIIYSEYSTEIPEYFHFKTLEGGYIRAFNYETSSSSSVFPGTSKRYDTKKQLWVFKDVPAFRGEKYITTPKDYLTKVQFELQYTKSPSMGYKDYSSTWIKIAKDLRLSEHFGAPLNRKFITKELSEKINPSDPDEKKVIQAYYLIKDKMKWNKSLSIYIENTLNSAYKKNEGNIAEINLLLINLLRSVGVQAYPVILSTRKHGQVNMVYPRIADFNAVVAMAIVNGKTVLLDATKSYLKPGNLSSNYINNKGLVILDTDYKWINLGSGEKMYYSTMVFMKLTDDSLNGTIRKTLNSLSALERRNLIAQKGKEKYIEDFEKNKADWDIEDYSIKNQKDINKPLIESMHVSNFNNIDTENDLIYLPAVLVSEIEKNPFSDETRNYPVDFTVPRYLKYVMIFEIPVGFELKEMPKNTIVTLPEKAGSFIYKAQKSGNNIQIFSKIEINKTTFLPEEYKLLKEFYTLIISKYGEQIVLKKI